MISNLRRWTLLWVTLVSVKESWGIRILLNIMRSTQIFNEILYKSSYLSQSCFKTKMLKINNDKNEFLMTIWILRVNFGRWIPTLSLYSLVGNLEVRLVVLNILIVFETFNATDPREFSLIILRIKKEWIKTFQGNWFLNFKFQNHFEPIFKNHIWFECTDFMGVVEVLTHFRHVNVLPNPIFVFRKLVNSLFYKF